MRRARSLRPRPRSRNRPNLVGYGDGTVAAAGKRLESAPAFSRSADANRTYGCRAAYRAAPVYRITIQAVQPHLRLAGRDGAPDFCSTARHQPVTLIATMRWQWRQLRLDFRGFSGEYTSTVWATSAAGGSRHHAAGFIRFSRLSHRRRAEFIDRDGVFGRPTAPHYRRRSLAGRRAPPMNAPRAGRRARRPARGARRARRRAATSKSASSGPTDSGLGSGEHTEVTSFSDPPGCRPPRSRQAFALRGARCRASARGEGDLPLGFSVSAQQHVTMTAEIGNAKPLSSPADLPAGRHYRLRYGGREARGKLGVGPDLQDQPRQHRRLRPAHGPGVRPPMPPISATVGLPVHRCA